MTHEPARRAAAPQHRRTRPSVPRLLSPDERPPARGWPSGGERPVVGCIGLGRLGTPIALRLRGAGFDVVAFDARAEAVEPLVAAGAIAAESAPGAAALSDVLVTVLPGPAQAEAVMTGRGGAFQALREGAVWVDMSTSTPALGRTLALEGEPRGVAVVDAPVAGRGPSAGAASLSVFAGGFTGDVERVRPVLEAVAGDPALVQHVGPRGMGHVVKLCLNLLRFVEAAAVAEVLVLGAKAGVETPVLQRALATGRPGVGLLQETIDGVLGGQPEPAFTLELVTRHLGLAVDLGRELGVPMELAALGEQLYRRARAVYGDEAGGTSIVRLAEEAAGVRLDPAG